MNRRRSKFFAALLLSGWLIAAGAAPGARAANGEDVRRAAELLEKARAAAADVRYEPHRAKTYRVIAHAQLRTGDDAGARATLTAARDALGKDHDAMVLSQALWELADDQIDAGDTAGARETLGRASRVAGRSFPTRAAAFNYAYIARRRARIGDQAGAALDLAAAADVASKEAGSSRDSALRYVAEGMAWAGRFDAAEAVAGGIPTPLDRSGALEAIAVARAEAGDVAGARKSAARTDEAAAESRMARARLRAGDVPGALAISAGITHSTQRDFAYNAIASAQAAAGDVAGAKSVAAKIERASERAEALAEVAIAEARGGNAAGALRTAAAATTDAADQDVPATRAALFTRIALARGLAGDADGARAGFAEARAAADKLDPKFVYDAGVKASALAAMAAAQAQLGMLDAARATMEAIDWDEEKAEACRAIAAAEVRRGGLSTLVWWIGALPDPMSRAYAYAGAAEAITAMGGVADHAVP